MDVRFKTLAITAFVILVLAGAIAGAKPFSTTGSLEGAGDEQYFEVYAGNDTYVEITFDLPEGVDFWVDVYGQYGNLLGSYNPQGDRRIIPLSGGGKFTIYVASEGGSGKWTAHWETD